MTTRSWPPVRSQTKALSSNTANAFQSATINNRDIVVNARINLDGNDLYNVNAFELDQMQSGDNAWIACVNELREWPATISPKWMRSRPEPLRTYHEPTHTTCPRPHSQGLHLYRNGDDLPPPGRGETDNKS